MFPFSSKAARLRVPAQHASGTMNVQRVKIRQQRGSSTRLTLLYVPLTIYFLSRTSDYWLPDAFKTTYKKIEEEVEEEKKKQISHKNEDKLAKQWKDQHARISRAREVKNSPAQSDVPPEGQVAWPANGTFIPIPFWLRARPRVPYNETDPEWVECMKLQKDPVRLEALKKIIVAETVKVLSGNRADVDALKALGPKLQSGRVLDVVIPLRRPQTFEQRGIFFDSKGGAPWLYGRPLSEKAGARINRILHPTVFVQSFWTAGSVFCKVSYASAKQSLLNWKFPEISTTIIAAPDTKQKTTQSASSTGNTKGASATTSPKIKPSVGFNDDLEIDEKPLMKFTKELSASVLPQNAVKKAHLAFLQTFGALQVRALQEVPNGACVIQGFIDFKGDRGKMRTSVAAIYMPAEDRFVGPVIVERSEILPDAEGWHNTVASYKAKMNQAKTAEERNAVSQQAIEKQLLRDAKEWQRDSELYAKAMRDFEKFREQNEQKRKVLEQHAKNYEENWKQKAPSLVKQVIGTRREEHARHDDAPEVTNKTVSPKAEGEHTDKSPPEVVVEVAGPKASDDERKRNEAGVIDRVTGPKEDSDRKKG